MGHKQGHRLAAPKTQTYPYHMIFFDTETEPLELGHGETEHRLRLGIACYVRREQAKQPAAEEWLSFDHAANFWDWALSRHHPRDTLYIFAHNLAFDFTVSEGWRYLERAGYKFQSMYSAERVCILKYRSSRGKLLLLDTANWYKTSVKALGETFGLPKGEIDFATASGAELEAYCWRDVEIIKTAMLAWIDFIREQELGGFALTVAGQSWRAFTHRFMPCDVYIHRRPAVSELERAAYFGGRCECFHIGEVPVSPLWVLDVNSMYPYVMSEHLYPTKLLRSGEGMSKGSLAEALKRRCLVAEVELEVSEPLYPVKREGKLIFPVGRLRATLTSPELSLALERGEIYEIGRYALYEAAYIFENWVEEVYAMRRAYEEVGDAVRALLAKYLLNTLYGKFGQQKVTWIDRGPSYFEGIRVEGGWCVETQRFHTFYDVYGKRWELVEGGESWNSFPAVAAHVTGYGRRCLADHIAGAGADHVYYCDTDSLLCDAVGLGNLAGVQDPTELGKLRVVSQVQRAVLHGAKAYILDGEVKWKGRRAEARHIEENTYMQEMWPSLKGVLRSGSPERYVVASAVRHFDAPYDKGEVLSDGRVVPYRLEEW